MTQTTHPRPLTIAVADVRRGDVIVTPTGERCYAAFDVETLTSGDVKVWTAVRDQEAGRPSSLVLHAGTTVLIAGPEDLPDNDQDTEDRQVAGEQAAHAAEFETVCESHGVTGECPEDVRIIDVTPTVVADEMTAAGFHVIDVIAPAPGAVRITVLEGTGRAAAAVLIGAGYGVARMGDVLTVTGDDW